MSTTVTLSSFNGSALFTVSPVGPNLSPLTPIVNVTVTAKETVAFSVPARGFYQMELSGQPAATPDYAISVIQSGVPLDTLLAGVVLVAIGSLVEISVRESRHWHRSKKIEDGQRLGTHAAYVLGPAPHLDRGDLRGDSGFPDCSHSHFPLDHARL